METNQFYSTHFPNYINNQQCLFYANEAEINDCSEETTPKADNSFHETVCDLGLLIMEEVGYALL